MFGKKESEKGVANRLQSLKQARPVEFSTLQKEALAKARETDREAYRKAVYKFGMVLTQGGEEARCVVRDISDTGAKIVLEGGIALPSEFRLLIDGYRAPAAATLKWQKDNEAGVKLA